MSRLRSMAEHLRGFLSGHLGHYVRRWINLTEYDLRRAERSDPFRGVTGSDENSFGSPYTFGVVKEFLGFHRPWLAGLKELGIPFRVLDFSRSDWLQQVLDNDCDLFLFWPSAHSSRWNVMYDDRARIIANELNRAIYPSEREIWLYENKRRQRDWLLAHGFPYPETRVFYRLDELEQYAEVCDLPVVYKTNTGAGASGVRIIRSRKKLRAFVRRAFSRGFIGRRADPRDRNWGYAILQQFLPGVDEWRIVRIGDSYYGYRKVSRSGLHSGSGVMALEPPPVAALDLARQITSDGEFTSLDVDIFRTRGGRLLVNELQTVFGTSAIERHVAERPDRFLRYRFRDAENRWESEAAPEAVQNAFVNERLRWLIETRYAG